MERPLVSVIIPAYNYAHFLPYAIQSVLNQTYQHFELIIINDASTDNTEEVVRSFTDKRIIYVAHQQNMELAATCNHGIELSKGKYVGVLSADDEWMPTFLQRCVQILEYYPDVGFVYSHVMLIDKDGKKNGVFTERIPHSSNFIGDDFVNIVKCLNPVPHHATLVRKAVFSKVGKYNTSLITTHDWDLWIRISKHYKVAYIHEPLACYRLHHENITIQRTKKRIKEKFMLQVLDSIFSDSNLSEELKDNKKDIYINAYLEIAFSYLSMDMVEDFNRIAKLLYKASPRFWIRLPIKRSLLFLLSFLNPKLVYLLHRIYRIIRLKEGEIAPQK